MDRDTMIAKAIAMGMDPVRAQSLTDAQLRRVTKPVPRPSRDDDFDYWIRHTAEGATFARIMGITQQ
ncbi:MAG: hypothetical protein QXP01_01260 [Candidatus Hadarchaeum sp.]